MPSYQRNSRTPKPDGHDSDTSAGQKRVPFAGVTAISRPVSNEEHWTLYYFEAHAAQCDSCQDPLTVARAGRQLCRAGYELAIDVADLLIYRRTDDEVYSRVKDSEREVRVEIPHDYEQTISLLKAINRAIRKGEKFPTKPRVLDKNYLIEPLIEPEKVKRSSSKDELQPLSMRRPYDTKLVAPKSPRPRPKPRRHERESTDDLIADSKRGSLYGDDMRRLEKAEKHHQEIRYNVEVREPNFKQQPRRPHVIYPSGVAHESGEDIVPMIATLDTPSPPPLASTDHQNEILLQPAIKDSLEPSRYPSGRSGGQLGKRFPGSSYQEPPESSERRPRSNRNSRDGSKDRKLSPSQASSGLFPSTGQELSVNPEVDSEEDSPGKFPPKQHQFIKLSQMDKTGVTTATAREPVTAHEHLRTDDKAAGAPDSTMTDIKPTYYPSWMLADNSDAESLAETIFSIGRTSLTSHTTTFSTEELGSTTELVAKCLLSNPRLKELCSKIIVDEVVTLAQFERQLRKLLRAYAKDLRQFSLSESQMTAVNFIHRHAGLVAQKIRNQCNVDSERSRRHLFEKKLGRLNKTDLNLSSASEGEESDIQQGNEISHRFKSLEPFLLSEDPIYKLCSRLAVIFWPSFESALESLDYRITTRASKFSSEIKSIQQLKCITKDLAQIDPSTIMMLDTYQPTGLEVLKHKLEIYTKAGWNWWPFQQPLRKLPKDHCYLKWTCRCEELRWEQVPLSFARELEMQVLKRISKLQQTPAIETSPSESIMSGRGCESDKQKGPMENTQSPRPNDSPPDSTNQSYGRSVSPHAQQTKISPPSLSQTSQFIFLSTEKWQGHTLAQINVQDLHDDTFFAELRICYRKARGIWRCIFSIWIYSHCKFSKFEKIEDHEYVPRWEGMPDPTNPEYKFRPKPADPMPPISEHEFKRKFYACFKGGKRHNHYFLSCRRRCRKVEDALERLPKRDRQIIEDGNNREIFWGLLAVEEISFAMVSLYHVLFVTGPFVFWILWLSVMNHPMDLQNASVPFTVAMSLLSLFWFPLLHR